MHIETVEPRFEAIDQRVTSVLARHSIPILRVSLGIVFFWFGALKLFPGLSPAQDLASRTISTLTLGMVGPSLSIPVLAVWEVLIGLGLLSGRLMRATLLLLAVQMVGTVLPIAFFPGEVFTRPPYAPTLEGQYIIKNLVLVAAAMVIGATVRGGGLRSEASAAPVVRR